MEKKTPVPPFDYDAWLGGVPHHGIGDFYRQLKIALNKGKRIDIEGQTDYLDYYINDVVLSLDLNSQLDRLTNIREFYSYSDYEKVTSRIVYCYSSLGRYDEALAELRSASMEYDAIRDYARYCASLGRWADLIEHLRTLLLEERYSSQNRLADYLIIGYIMLGECKEAIAFLKRTIKLGTINRSLIDHIWSLKLNTVERIDGMEILSMGSQLTSFGKRNLNRIAECIDKFLEQYEYTHSINLLEIWTENSTIRHTYGTTVQHPVPADIKTQISHVNFGINPSVVLFAERITRLAENSVREEMGLPNVGEGWLSETELYYSIKQALPDYDVHQHYSPHWLGRQHLDIFIPALRIALEYQGKQHDEPIEFFGGQEGFERNKQRDARKKLLCDKYGVQIIYVRPGYNLSHVLDEVRECSQIEIRVSEPIETLTDYRTLPLFQFVEEQSADMSFEKKTRDSVIDQLLRLDPRPEPEENEFEYKLPPGFSFAPIKYEIDPCMVREAPHKSENVDRFKYLSYLIPETYAKRNSEPSALEKTIELCREQISLSHVMARYQYHWWRYDKERRQQNKKYYEHDPEALRQYLREDEEFRLGKNDGYKRIAIILEKQGKHEEALTYVLKAKSEGWAGDWDKRIVRLIANIEQKNDQSFAT